MNLTVANSRWLATRFPNLSICEEGISGEIEFTATYNENIHRFLILAEGIDDAVGGRRQTARFKIRIRERPDTRVSRLPALYVEGVDATADRHFQPDQCACLCSPLEEADYLNPDLDFPRFLEQLVIPFLYGQTYYDMEGRWPWPDYGHGAVGLLESYWNVNDPAKAGECLARLRTDSMAWPGIRRSLVSKLPIKGSIPCFCPTADLIRRCHPLAWRGIVRLKQDISSQGIVVPSIG